MCCWRLNARGGDKSEVCHSAMKESVRQDAEINTTQQEAVSHLTNIYWGAASSPPCMSLHGHTNHLLLGTINPGNCSGGEKWIPHWSASATELPKILSFSFWCSYTRSKLGSDLYVLSCVISLFVLVEGEAKENYTVTETKPWKKMKSYMQVLWQEDDLPPVL